MRKINAVVEKFIRNLASEIKNDPSTLQCLLEDNHDLVAITARAEADKILAALWIKVEEKMPEGVTEKDFAIEMLERGNPVRNIYTGAGDDLTYMIEQNKESEIPIIRWMEIPS